jgi:hypothetical protein
MSRVERDETKRRSCEGAACFSQRREQGCCLAPHIGSVRDLAKPLERF